MKDVVAVLAITMISLFGGLAGACSLVFSPDIDKLGEIVFLGFAICFGCFALARLVWLATFRPGRSLAKDAGPHDPDAKERPE